jgi:3-oxoadipate enol-lactonase
MNFATISGVTLHYKLEGDEKGMPLVFINSLGTDLRIWDGVVAHFAGRFRLVRYDKRGHGLSDCPPGPYSLRDQRDDLAGLLRHLDVEAPIVAGISVGGMIALDYAAHYPVRALVLSDSALRFGTAILQNGMAEMAGRLAPRWFAPDFGALQPALYQGACNMLARMPAAGYMATCALLANSEVSDIAGAIDGPSLVLGGAQDQAATPEMGRALAGAMRDARFELLENAGHLPCIEQPVAMAQAMTRFFEEIGYG